MTVGPYDFEGSNDFWEDDWIPLPPTDDPSERLTQDEKDRFNRFYDETSKRLLPADEPRRDDRGYHLIAAARGDDFLALSDHSSYGICYLMGMDQQGMKISWKDVNYSKVSAFFAESLILLPQTMYMHWEYTLRRNKGNNVPLILDPVTLKSLTPVRKQVNLETDLPSKMRLLTTRAQWCDPSWPTYHFHQHAILMGLVIFDMEGSFQFPFLLEANGGCGGLPPYGNSGTAHSALFHHNRGGMTKSVLGIMRESVAVNACRLKPKDSVFLKWVYQAQAGDDAWLRAVGTVAKAKGIGYSDEEILDIIKVEDYDPFPDELKQYLISVPVENPFVGSTISALRKDGLLYTKLDIKEYLANRKMDLAYYGTETMGAALLDVKLRKKNARSQSLQLLREVLGGSTSLSRDLLDTIPDDPQTQREIMGRYYEDFLIGNTALSSLCYGEKAEVLFAQHVEAFISSGGKAQLRSSIGIGEDSAYAQLYAPGLARNETTPVAEAWIKDLERGRKSLPPVTFGPRDAHILLGIQNAMETFIRPIIVIVTSDKKLIVNARKWAHYCGQLPSTKSGLVPAVACISAETLFVQAMHSRKQPRKEGPELTDPITMRSFHMTKALENQLRFRAGTRARDREREKWIVLYDEPNISRTIGNLQIAGKELLVYTDGGIRNELAHTNEKWDKWPMDKLPFDLGFGQRGVARRFPIRKILDCGTEISSSKDSWNQFDFQI